MFILTPIVINSSLTSKQAHVCSGNDNGISNGSLTSLKLSLVALIRFPNTREKEKRLKPSPLSTCNKYFSLPRHYLAYPNGGDMHG